MSKKTNGIATPEQTVLVLEEALANRIGELAYEIDRLKGQLSELESVVAGSECRVDQFGIQLAQFTKTYRGE